MTYRFNWKLTVFYLAFMPVFLSLGIWQLERGEDKKTMQKQLESAQHKPGVRLEQLLEKVAKEIPDSKKDSDAKKLKESLRYQKVTVHGRFDNTHNFLLDNRLNQGRFGYEVVTPFRLDKPFTDKSTGGLIKQLWVNRGWVSGGTTRAVLPEIPEVVGTVELTAKLDPQMGKPFVLAEAEQPSQWPRRVQSFDAEKMATQIAGDTGFFPHQLRLEPEQGAALETIWQPVNMSSAKHTGYAVQWFAMAAALTFLYFYASANRNHD